MHLISEAFSPDGNNDNMRPSPTNLPIARSQTLAEKCANLVFCSWVAGVTHGEKISQIKFVLLISEPHLCLPPFSVSLPDADNTTTLTWSYMTFSKMLDLKTL